jgi:hypothetical protein
MKRYAVVFEKAENNWAAYVPDLPRCVTTGKRSKRQNAMFERPSSFTWNRWTKSVKWFLSLHPKWALLNSTRLPSPSLA